jgi:hypothetical protein
MGINCHVFAPENESGDLATVSGAQVEDLEDVYRVQLPDSFSTPFFDIPKELPTVKIILELVAKAQQAEDLEDHPLCITYLQSAFHFLSKSLDPDYDPRFIDEMER